MIGHPDADILAACREGLLGRRRSARIRAHLARCSRCASLDHELAAVTSLLASAPAPRIPDELAARLDTVLAAESAARARGESPTADGIPATADGIPATAGGIPATAGATTGPADGGSGPAGQAGPLPSRPRSTRPARPWHVTALRAASVTAALLVIAGGGYGVSRLLRGGNSAENSPVSGGSHSLPNVAPGVQVPRHGGNSAAGPSRGGLMIPSGGVSLVHSGTDYQPGQLAAQAEAVLARRSAKSGGQSTSPVPTTLAGCVRLFAGVARPILVDEASYGGQPATIIIRAPAGHRPGHVWVIVPSCSSAGRQLVRTAVLPASG
jgi:hypothetical protein